MKKKHPALKRLIAVTLCCAAPYVILPLISDHLPEEMLWGISFLLCHLCVPISALFAPYFIARAGIPAIAAWPWPILCGLILPLWGMQPGLFAMAAGTLIAIVSAVAGEEMRRRQTSANPRKRRR